MARKSAKATRRRAREIALQVLFQHGVGRLPVREALATVQREPLGGEWGFVEELCTGAAKHARALDRIIEGQLEGWTLDRIASVDRIVLRMAIYELRHMGGPRGAVINEAVLLAKKYGTGDSGKFVNGVLGAIARGEPHEGGSPARRVGGRG